MLLLSDLTVSDAAEFSVSQQTDLLLIFGAKDCSVKWIASNFFQVKFLFYFVFTSISKAYILSLSFKNLIE